MLRTHSDHLTVPLRFKLYRFFFNVSVHLDQVQHSMEFQPILLSLLHTSEILRICFPFPTLTNFSHSLHVLFRNTPSNWIRPRVTS